LEKFIQSVSAYQDHYSRLPVRPNAIQKPSQRKFLLRRREEKHWLATTVAGISGEVIERKRITEFRVKVFVPSWSCGGREYLDYRTGLVNSKSPPVQRFGSFGQRCVPDFLLNTLPARASRFPLPAVALQFMPSALEPKASEFK